MGTVLSMYLVKAVQDGHLYATVLSMQLVQAVQDSHLDAVR